MTQPPIRAADAAPRATASNYPEPFAGRMSGRIKRPLGDLFGLGNFGVNLTQLRPGTVSALPHVHSRQDEMIYVLEGKPTVILDGEAHTLGPGMVMGFAAGGPVHHVENLTAEDCVILEIGDRSGGDEVRYPADDLQVVTDADGRRRFAHKDGTPY